MGIKGSEIAKIMICRVKQIFRIMWWFIRLSVNSCSSYVQVNSQSNALVCPLSISYDGSSLLLSSRSVPTYLQMIFQFPITNGSISWYLQLPTLSACSVTSDRRHICKFPCCCSIVQIIFSYIKSQVWGKLPPICPSLAGSFPNFRAIKTSGSYVCLVSEPTKEQVENLILYLVLFSF